MFESAAVILLRLGSFILYWLPRSAALAIGKSLGTIAYFLSSRRGVAYVNLKAAFGSRFTPRERKKIVRLCFSNLAQNAVELLRVKRVDASFREKYVHIHNIDLYQRLFEAKQGAVLLTPHFGNWEMTQVVSAILGKPLYVLARRQRYPKLNDFLNYLRGMKGTVTIQKGDGIRAFVRWLKEKKVVGALGDLSGGRDGTLVRFFGRLTTAPEGIFSIARRTESQMLPVFCRRSGMHYEIFLDGSYKLQRTDDLDSDVAADIKNYYGLLESWISRYPDQWFWVYKRWKYCFTKRILLIHDGRPGHRSQMQGVAQRFKELLNEIDGRFEFEIKILEVGFKSEWHRRIFSFLAPFAIPFVQGRLNLLKPFLTHDSATTLASSHADVVVSAGSSMIPLNMMLCRENRAKSVVCMTPSGLYTFFLFDMLIVPEHDKARGRARHVVKTVLAPNELKSENERCDHEVHPLLQPIISMRNNNISIFVGGNTRSYRMQPEAVRNWLSHLRNWAEHQNMNLIVTTSRRTESVVEEVVKETMGNATSCKLLVIANESNPDGIVKQMLSLSSIAFVTEDSVAMVSEALSAQKKVFVVKLGKKLPRKHQIFHHILASKGLIKNMTGSDFLNEMANWENWEPAFSELNLDRLKESLKVLL